MLRHTGGGSHRIKRLDEDGCFACAPAEVLPGWLAEWTDVCVCHPSHVSRSASSWSSDLVHIYMERNNKS